MWRHPFPLQFPQIPSNWSSTPPAPAPFGGGCEIKCSSQSNSVAFGPHERATHHFHQFHQFHQLRKFHQVTRLLRRHPFPPIPSNWSSTPPAPPKISRRSAPERLSGPLREGRSAASPKRIPFFQTRGQLLTATFAPNQKIGDPEKSGRPGGRPDFSGSPIFWFDAKKHSATWIFWAGIHRSCVPFKYRSIAAAGSKISKG